jgi:tetratricopeptide (TPR) repeat protein
MLVMTGIGGMGKTSITWVWINCDVLGRSVPGIKEETGRSRVPNKGRPEGIFQWSFYHGELSFSQFLSKACMYTGGDPLPSSSDGEVKDSDRLDLLLQRFMKHRFLFLLDGFERLLCVYASQDAAILPEREPEEVTQDERRCVDPLVARFLSAIVAGGSTKVLVTSRLLPYEIEGLAGCRHKDLEGLHSDDAVAYLRKSNIKGLDWQLREEAKAYGNHPLSLSHLVNVLRDDLDAPYEITQAPKYDVTSDLKARRNHILEHSYNRLPQKLQEFLSRLAANRGSILPEIVELLAKGIPKQQLQQALDELEDRKWILWDRQQNLINLHPVVRRFAYGKLKEKEQIHEILRSYWLSLAETVKKENVERVEDLTPIIELYHHTVSSGRYDEARKLYRDRLAGQLYYQFGAYQTIIELLRALFPDGEDRPPRLKKEAAQAWTLAALANSYSLSGQLQKAVPLFEKVNDIYENVMKNKKYLAIGLGNLAYQQIAIGDLEAAESNLRRRIDLCQEIKDEFREAIGHQELGRLLAYSGRFSESEKELAKGLELFTKIEGTDQQQGVGWSYRALRALLMEDADKALKHALRARELADDRYYEQDIIWAEWLLGAAYLAKADLQKAEFHLHEALARDRRINLVDLEPDILLELAKLRFAQGQKEEAKKLAKEALEIADRCQYRLKQADIHNFLTEYYIDAKDLAKAKAHLEIAREKAACGYQPALKKAQQLQERIKRNKR